VPRGSGSTRRIDLAELARAAGLLLVAVVALRLGGDGLAIRDARRPRLDLELELARHALEHRAQMQVPQTAEDHLVDRGIVLDDECRVLRHHLVQHVGDALLVAAALGRDREPVHGHRELQRPHVDVVLVVGVVQHAVEGDLVDLRHRGQVARHGVVDLDVLAALEREQVPDLERLAAVARRRAGCRA
jgi:hypothetical protein